LTLQDLKSHLWDCAEILRGSAVDRTDWKAYILPLLFFKRISDVYDEESTFQRSIDSRSPKEATGETFARRPPT
jgi:type I restriction-modification system DNA methylase subunit